MKYECRQCCPEEEPCYLEIRNGSIENTKYCPDDDSFNADWIEYKEYQFDNNKIKEQQFELKIKELNEKNIKLQSQKDILLDILLKNA